MNVLAMGSFFLGLALLCILRRILSASHKRNKFLPPPEPSGAWPLIGHMRILNSQIPIFRALGDLADKHGPVFSIRLGMRRTLVISSWESVKECFKTNDRKFLDRPSFAASKYIAYDDAFFGFHRVMFRLIAEKKNCGVIAKESEAFERALKELFYLSGVLEMSDSIPFTGWMDLYRNSETTIVLCSD
ncbi:hypothetical protein DKX38_023376 [Salix brachista]|uniref:Cytochrome P450 n=1 Tax=Salix brachista TaxID=2182728 RepID=A0A5N5JWI8_9ROSI|nr:hypothetical protein DKX38_023376 [Salix brachista]